MNRQSKQARVEWASVHWAHRARIMFDLLKNVRDGKNLIGIEIGVWKGDLIIALLGKGSPMLKLYGVDPYHAYIGEDGELSKGWGQGKWDDVFIRVKKRMMAYSNRFELIRATSDDFGKTIPDRSYDFVELDGDHNYDQVMRDIIQYEKKIIKGGLLCGHDYYGKPQWIGGVNRAVDKYAKVEKRELHTDLDSWMWWWFVE